MPTKKETRPGEAARRREAGLVPVTVWVPAERRAEVLLLAQKMSHKAPPCFSPVGIATDPLKTVPPSPSFTSPISASPLPLGLLKSVEDVTKVDVKTQDIINREAILRVEAAKMEKLSRMKKLVDKMRKKNLAKE